MFTMNNYEVIIIGAGPGGAMAALHSKGDVLLVEKKKEIGVPVRCGEGIFGKIVDYFNLHKYIKDAHILHNVEFNFPNGKQKKIRMRSNVAYMINKDKFLQNMLHDVVKKDDISLTIRTNTKAKYMNGKIILNGKEEVTGKVIIAADGINSSIGRAVGLTTLLKPEDMHICAQYRLEGDFDPDTVRLFLDRPYAPSGYVWVFPKGNHTANVGLGIQGSRHLNVKQQLDWFVRDCYPLSKKKDFFTAPVSLAPPVNRCMRKNILLVGDAARYTISPNGAGMGTAMLSGQTAGDVASKYLAGEYGLEAYQYAMSLKLYSKLLKAHNLKQKVMGEDGAEKFYRIFARLFWLHKLFPKTTERFCLKF